MKYNDSTSNVVTYPVYIVLLYYSVCPLTSFRNHSDVNKSGPRNQEVFFLEYQPCRQLVSYYIPKRHVLASYIYGLHLYGKNQVKTCAYSYILQGQAKSSKFY